MISNQPGDVETSTGRVASAQYNSQLPFIVSFYRKRERGMRSILIELGRRNLEPISKKAKKPAPATPRINITTATAQKGDIGVYLDEIGTVTPVYTVSVSPQVNGPIVAVHHKEGQILKKGDPLVDIDSRPYRATLLQAQGALERDQSLLAQAKMDLDRYRAAWARNAIQKQLLDDQEKLVLQDEGTVKNDQGTVRFDEIQVEYSHITAPVAGRVGLRLVNRGNVVQFAGSR